MRFWTKILAIISVIISSLSLVWYSLGTTACFQRGLDLIGTLFFINMWFPLLLITVFSTKLLIKGRVLTVYKDYILIYSLIITMLLFSVILVQNTNTQGWLTEIVRSDTLKITEDSKYEYRLDLINLFQKNSKARLYLRNIKNGEEQYIAININTDTILGLVIKKETKWATMGISEKPNCYYLYITDELDILEKKFEIDVVKGTSKLLEYKKEDWK